MPRQSLEERNIRKLLKNNGGTTYVSIPVEMMRSLKWRDGQKVVVEQKGETLVIKDWKK